MQTRFEIREIQSLALDYLKKGRPLDLVREARIETMYAHEVRLRGWFMRSELVEMCRWMNLRLVSRVEANEETFIQEVTHTALSTSDERLRIEVLMLLRGVSWPQASAVLHFCHAEPYPILGSRQLWSLGVLPTARVLDFSTWMEYTRYCRELAREVKISMRMLDRALVRYAALNAA